MPSRRPSVGYPTTPTWNPSHCRPCRDDLHVNPQHSPLPHGPAAHLRYAQTTRFGVSVNGGCGFEPRRPFQHHHRIRSSSMTETFPLLPLHRLLAHDQQRQQLDVFINFTRHPLRRPSSTTTTKSTCRQTYTPNPSSPIRSDIIRYPPASTAGRPTGQRRRLLPKYRPCRTNPPTAHAPPAPRLRQPDRPPGHHLSAPIFGPPPGP